ncbi:hypothetical protein BU24DRAFT_460028 [Aaosphaeria arxii CBS 175.79]|uniref:Uncharacterized protein n=1 Tax=Aaosphaeria arxii CBS 175.79 TaxID=1450172 RepID=A0A6A5XVR5_9PLEO|nr:uncharacterized protein BU24DRAFT_460028 [Aaosphaeria arxii CBS 175.79]KAF2016917.1 hypothetical protein BU24DRAFT_460028 [Aaosphaeria arxii CBS 175.79]
MSSPQYTNPVSQRPLTPPESEDDMSSQPGSKASKASPPPSSSAIDFNKASQFDSGYFGEAVHAPGESPANTSDEEKDAQKSDSPKGSASTPKAQSKSSSHLPITPSPTPARHRTSTPQPIDIERPYTPTPLFPKTLNGQQSNIGVPQYPYTPDSARSAHGRSHVFPTVTPLPSMPWTDPVSPSGSPVQSALSSCISKLENLIQSSQPNDVQMEHIVAQFESISSFLSAPESQTRQTDDVLFTELENTLNEEGDNVHADGKTTQHDGEGLNLAEVPDHLVAKEYVGKVGRYILGVKKHVDDLKLRMEEVKLLNSIQVDIIQDLRTELRTRIHETGGTGNLSATPSEDEATSSGGSTPRRFVPPYQASFWGSVREALDQVGDIWLDW